MPTRLEELQAALGVAPNHADLLICLTTWALRQWRYDPLDMPSSEWGDTATDGMVSQVTDMLWHFIDEPSQRIRITTPETVTVRRSDGPAVNLPRLLRGRNVTMAHRDPDVVSDMPRAYRYELRGQIQSDLFATVKAGVRDAAEAEIVTAVGAGQIGYHRLHTPGFLDTVIKTAMVLAVCDYRVLDGTFRERLSIWDAVDKGVVYP